jgi:hypothetical protein
VRLRRAGSLGAGPPFSETVGAALYTGQGAGSPSGGAACCSAYPEFDLHAVRSSERMGARWGGEEFVLILPDSGASQALEVVDRLRAKLAENLLAGSIPAFTASFGISDRTLQSCVAETAGEGQRSSGR